MIRRGRRHSFLFAAAAPLLAVVACNTPVPLIVSCALLLGLQGKVPENVSAEAIVLSLVIGVLQSAAIASCAANASNAADTARATVDARPPHLPRPAVTSETATSAPVRASHRSL